MSTDIETALMDAIKAMEHCNELDHRINDLISLCGQWQRLAEGWEDLYRRARQ